MKSTPVFKSLLLGLMILVTQYSHAHVMVAQHGTLNVIDDGVFMVLSLPVSAFDGTDDDKDGHLSKAEFDIYRAGIAQALKEKIVLSDKNGKLELKGLILSLVASHEAPKDPASQLIVMGKFILNDLNSALIYQVDIFGKQQFEQILDMTVKNKVKGLKQVFRLTPDAASAELFTG